MSGSIMTLVMFVLLIYMVVRTFMLAKKNNKNKKLLKVLDEINDEQKFFDDADKVIAEEKDKTFAAKIEVLRIWGDVYYRREKAFREHLSALDIELLLHPQGSRTDGFNDNEDSFFYLYTAIPNHLWSIGRNDLREAVNEKLKPYHDALSDTFLSVMHDSFALFYDNKEDKGRSFYNAVMNGDYGQYRYNKQLIGLYKDMITVMLARLALDDGSAEGIQPYEADLKRFAETRLGARWMKELSVELPSDEKTEEETKDAEPAEETAEDDKKEQE
ncbi:MAG: hypothetical protein VZT48_00005 [Bulleidia sp.]|nr:hypothetical protein [Bulleidia sp.]